MHEDTKTPVTATIGLDLGDRRSHACVLAEPSGEVVERFEVPTTPEGLRARFGRRARSRVVVEASGPSPWVSRLLTELGHEVFVANTARLALISKSDRKTDRQDAQTLAHLGRTGLGLLGRPVLHRGQREQCHLEVIKARDALVRSRTALVNHVRGVLKSHGSRAPRCSADTFHLHAPDAMPEDLAEILDGVIEQISRLTAAIRRYERRIEEVAEEHYPAAGMLRQVNGVGPITSLAYVLVLGDPYRFRHSRAVGPYLGLTPATQQSGARDPQLGISKAGNPFLRRLLVGDAQYILGPFGTDCTLRRYGLALCQRGGPNARRRAVVAVARKLAVLLHRLWVTGEVYDPLRGAAPPVEAATPTA